MKRFWTGDHSCSFRKGEWQATWRREEFPVFSAGKCQDIHSPLIPSQQECESILLQLCQVLPADQLWVNPDCGLKTRRWEEVRPALTHLVAAAQSIRVAQRKTI